MLCSTTLPIANTDHLIEIHTVSSLTRCLVSFASQGRAAALSHKERILLFFRSYALSHPESAFITLYPTSDSSDGARHATGLYRGCEDIDLLLLAPSIALSGAQVSRDVNQPAGRDGAADHTPSSSKRVLYGRVQRALSDEGIGFTLLKVNTEICLLSKALLLVVGRVGVDALIVCYLALLQLCYTQRQPTLSLLALAYLEQAPASSRVVQSARSICFQTYLQVSLLRHPTVAGFGVAEKSSSRAPQSVSEGLLARFPFLASNQPAWLEWSGLPAPVKGQGQKVGRPSAWRVTAYKHAYPECLSWYLGDIGSDPALCRVLEEAVVLFYPDDTSSNSSPPVKSKLTSISRSTQDGFSWPTDLVAALQSTTTVEPSRGASSYVHRSMRCDRDVRLSSDQGEVASDDAPDGASTAPPAATPLPSPSTAAPSATPGEHSKPVPDGNVNPWLLLLQCYLSYSSLRYARAQQLLTQFVRAVSSKMNALSSLRHRSSTAVSGPRAKPVAAAGRRSPPADQLDDSDDSDSYEAGLDEEKISSSDEDGSDQSAGSSSQAGALYREIQCMIGTAAAQFERMLLQSSPHAAVAGTARVELTVVEHAWWCAALMTCPNCV